MSWRERANCRGLDPALFFPARGDDAAVVAARAVCAGCTVVAECLDFALGTTLYSEGGGPAGIWGGTTQRQRRRLRASA